MTKEVKQIFKLKRKKIPTPQTFELCPLCSEPMKKEWDDNKVDVLYYCKNGECEINYLTTKQLRQGYS